MQAFYVKKEKIMSNVYHKLKKKINHLSTKNWKKMKQNPFQTRFQTYFFKEYLIKKSKTINLKRLH